MKNASRVVTPAEAGVQGGANFLDAGSSPA